MSSSRFIRFASASKLRKSLICRFRRISISPRKFPEKPKHECAEEFKNTTLKRRRRNSKSRTSAAISGLAGCGCHSRLGIIPDPMIPADSQMPELCSVQSLPSCSSPESKVEQCPEWRLSRSFDEMLKGSSTSHGGEVHYNHKSSMDNSLVELQISAVKFNDLVTKINGGKMVNQKTVGLVSRGLASPKVSSPRRSVRKTVNDSPATSTNKMIQSNVKRGQMTDSLLIMKLPSDPRREFRDSMMEMIAENKIRAWKDLEELLACYLLLNSAAYHDVIIQVFKQIWVDLIHAQQNNKRNKY